MKKLLLIFFAFYYTLNFAQSIELPDFVITGVQSVNIPVLPKKSPEPISTITVEFIKPLYNPEDLKISEASAPIKVDAEIMKTKPELNGSFAVAAGLNTQPFGEAFFYNNFDKIFLYSKVYGKYIRAYEPNADLSTTGVDFSSTYFVDNKYAFLPSTKVQFAADYNRTWYKHFRTINAEYQNKIQTGSASLNIENTYLKEFNFGLSLKTDGIFTNTNNYKSMNVIAEGNFSSDLRNFRLNVSGNYIKQYISKAKTINYNYDYWNTEITAKYTPNTFLSLGAGIYVASYDTNSFFSPIGFAKLNFSNNFFADVQFNPTTKFLTFNELFKLNRYMNIGKVDNNYVEEKVNFSASLRFIYQKLVEATVGFRIKNIDNQLYFSDKLNKGYFDIFAAKDVDMLEIFSDYYFKIGDFGDIFGQATLNSTKMNGGYILPYMPAFTISNFYKYNYDEELSFTLGLEWKHKRYSDELNLNTIPDYLNISLKTEYTLYENLGLVLTFENITNNKNYTYIDYLEKPFDIYAGINYKW